MTKLGLVLSGGGSKGAYEVGVYIALKKLHKKIDIVTGTSIGAINGMLFTQKDLKGAIKFWKHINFKTMYDENYFTALENDKLSKIYAEYAKNFINEGGLDTTKMKVMFDEYFKPFKFFHSKIDYGLVTYNLSKNKPVFKTKKDLTKENVKDYVLSSASCYPAFKPYIIDDELYIDGGYYDNMPLNLAIDLGAKEIIAVDLRAVGFKKNLKDKTVEVTYIAPRNKIGSFLIFDKAQAKKSMKFGYNDTMKTFNKLEGNKFTFIKYNLIKNYNKYADSYEKKLKDLFKSDNVILNKIFESSAFKDILNNKITYNNFNSLVELAGETFNFDETVIYNIKSYNKGLINSLSNTESVSINKITNNFKNKDLKSLVDKTAIVKYFYLKIKENELPLKYILLFTNEFLIALYIYIVKGNRTIY